MKGHDADKIEEMADAAANAGVGPAALQDARNRVQRLRAEKAQKDFQDMKRRVKRTLHANDVEPMVEALKEATSHEYMKYPGMKRMIYEGRKEMEDLAKQSLKDEVQSGNIEKLEEALRISKFSRVNPALIKEAEEKLTKLYDAKLGLEIAAESGEDVVMDRACLYADEVGYPWLETKFLREKTQRFRDAGLEMIEALKTDDAPRIDAAVKVFGGIFTGGAYTPARGVHTFTGGVCTPPATALSGSAKVFDSKD